jgi:hypothetical protein
MKYGKSVKKPWIQEGILEYKAAYIRIFCWIPTTIWSKTPLNHWLWVERILCLPEAMMLLSVQQCSTACWEHSNQLASNTSHGFLLFTAQNTHTSPIHRHRELLPQFYKA